MQVIDLREEMADILVFVQREEPGVVFMISFFPSLHIFRSTNVGSVPHADEGGEARLELL